MDDMWPRMLIPGWFPLILMSMLIWISFWFCRLKVGSNNIVIKNYISSHVINLFIIISKSMFFQHLNLNSCYKKDNSLASIELDVGNEAVAWSYPRISPDVCTTRWIGTIIPCPLLPSPPLVYPIFLSNRDPISMVYFLNIG